MATYLEAERKAALHVSNMEVVAKATVIEGFNPDAEIQPITISRDRKKDASMWYLPVATKRKMFRLLYPDGFLKAEELFPAVPVTASYKEKLEALTECPFVTVKVTCYVDGNPVAMDVQTVTQDDIEDTAVEKRYQSMLSMATGKAESRCLYYLGIGAQYLDPDDPSIEKELGIEGTTAIKDDKHDMGIPDDFGVPATTPEVEKPKRKRRTKAEIEAESSPAPSEPEEPAPIPTSEDTVKNEAATEPEPEEIPWDTEDKDITETVCSYSAYKGQTYKALAASPNVDILAWIIKKDIPDIEVKAICAAVADNKNVREKIKRWAESPECTRPELINF